MALKQYTPDQILTIQTGLIDAAAEVSSNRKRAEMLIDVAMSDDATSQLLRNRDAFTQYWIQECGGDEEAGRLFGEIFFGPQEAFIALVDAHARECAPAFAESVRR